MELQKFTKVTHTSHNKAEVYKGNTSSSPHPLFFPRKVRKQLEGGSAPYGALLVLGAQRGQCSLWLEIFIHVLCPGNSPSWSQYRVKKCVRIRNYIFVILNKTVITGSSQRALPTPAPHLISKVHLVPVWRVFGIAGGNLGAQ